MGLSENCEARGFAAFRRASGGREASATRGRVGHAGPDFSFPSGFRCSLVPSRAAAILITQAVAWREGGVDEEMWRQESTSLV